MRGDLGPQLPQPGAVRRAQVPSRSLVPALALLAFTMIVLGASQVALMYSGVPVPPPWQVLLYPIAAGSFLAAGIIAWLRRPSNRSGALLVAGALALLASALTNVANPALAAAGIVTATIPFAILVHLFHAFPSGRLRGRMSTVTVAAGYLVCIVLQAPLYVWTPGPLQVADRPDLASAGHWVQHGVGLLVMILTAVVLAGRLAGMTRSERRVVAPLYAYGIAAVLWLPLCTDLNWVAGWSPLVLVEVQLLALAVIPVAVVSVMLLGGFARTGEIQELAAWLGGEEGGRPSLQQALAATLGDPSLELAFWFSDSSAYVTAAGEPVALPEPDAGRGAVEIASGAERIGAIVYDATLISDPALVDSAGRVVALALERERLTAALRANRDRLRASRARIAGAADAERRRIARDLHDGLQTRLIMLGIKAHAVRRGTLRGHGGDAEELHSGLQAAIAELRDLVHGVMPAVLTERGLYAAVQELADAMPIPTRVELDYAAEPLSAPTESAAYFVVSEAFTNALKHSRARELRLRITRGADQLTVEVTDDGIGGVRGDGTGVRGMADRIEALGGWLRFESPPDGGTRVVARVPCGS